MALLKFHSQPREGGGGGRERDIQTENANSLLIDWNVNFLCRLPITINIIKLQSKFLQ
jgi:hypothetical protein